MPKRKKPHGGKRPGAGRPPSGKALVPVSIRLKQEEIDFLLEAYGSVSDGIRRILVNSPNWCPRGQAG